MKRFKRILVGVGIGTIALVIFGLLKGPPTPARPSNFWKEPIPSTVTVADAAYGDAISEARSSLIERMQHFGTPGLSVAIAIKHQLVWVECLGYSDIEKRTLVNPSTKFRVGSVSKPFTAALIARLYDEGKLDLDAPIQKYLPNHPKKEHSFTIRQLAGHLAGIGSPKRQEFVNTKHYRSIDESLEEFQDDELLFPPDCKFHYSGEGFTILSAIAEAVSGRDYLSLMEEMVFRPLQMTNTCPDQANASNVTVYYDNYSKKDRLPEIATFHDSSRHWAAGGFLSTPLDMIQFAHAHLTGVFLRPQTIAMLFASQKTNAGDETGYGIGWSSWSGPPGRRQVRHLGDTVGGQAFLVMFPEVELVITLVCTGNFWNYHGDGSSGATDRLSKIFLRAIEAIRSEAGQVGNR